MATIEYIGGKSGNLVWYKGKICKKKKVKNHWFRRTTVLATSGNARGKMFWFLLSLRLFRYLGMQLQALSDILFPTGHRTRFGITAQPTLVT